MKEIQMSHIRGELRERNIVLLEEVCTTVKLVPGVQWNRNTGEGQVYVC